jgi:hypothetical protein
VAPTVARALDTTPAATGCARPILPVLRSAAGNPDAEALAARTDAGVQALMGGEVMARVGRFFSRSAEADPTAGPWAAASSPRAWRRGDATDE